MALPKINEEVVFNTIGLPSGKNIGIHAWKVKEEKELLFAVDSVEDDISMESEIMKFLKRCTNDADKFDDLSNTDMLYIAMELRRLSKGDGIEYEYPCPHCKHSNADEVKISKNSVVKKLDYTPIEIGDIRFTLKDVPYKEMKKIAEECKGSLRKYNYKFMLCSIDSIAVKEELFTEFSAKDLEDFIDQFSSEQFDKLTEEIMKRMPDVKLEKKLKCKKCKEEFDVQYGNLYDFFVF